MTIASTSSATPQTPLLLCSSHSANNSIHFSQAVARLKHRGWSSKQIIVRVNLQVVVLPALVRLNREVIPQARDNRIGECTPLLGANGPGKFSYVLVPAHQLH